MVRVLHLSLIFLACFPTRAVVYGIPPHPVIFTRYVTLVGFAEIDEEDPLSSLLLAAANASAGPNVRAVTAMLFPSEMTEAPPIRERSTPKATIPELHFETA
jgi:hypothetical protein